MKSLEKPEATDGSVKSWHYIKDRAHLSLEAETIGAMSCPEYQQQLASTAVN